MLKAYKTELSPTVEQKSQTNKTLGVCRYLYNLYLGKNKERHRQGLKFMTANEFDKWINNEHWLENPWIKEVSSKARKKSIVNGETAFKRFFKGLAKFPRFKKKKDQNIKFYAPKNGHGDWTVERHRIKVPTLGWVKLKEFGYIPTGARVTGGTVSQAADRYYVSVTIEVPEMVNLKEEQQKDGIGIDLGLKHFAVVSDEITYRNMNKSSAIRKVEKKLKREQRSLSRKYENKKRGENSATHRGRNIAINVTRVQKIHHRLANMRSEYRAFVVTELTKTKPAFITVEHLNVKGMMKNRHLSRSIAGQGFYDFKLKLLNACLMQGIQLREVSQFYPSSKQCSNCGNKKEKLSLSERVYHCEACNQTIDRDVNAAINLKQATEYVILT